MRREKKERERMCVSVSFALFFLLLHRERGVTKKLLQKTRQS
ncbi:hypothetical protein CSUI_005076 [Cystoisospora suis]|uniref:Uncharacterized protein n=1 Tax=Cystoisospora suis TaxID=483139 RepID=A0A2C6KZ98_9APIC|nr:hypothetical protein CSUI_005076 [Cystoisospora suis]